MASLAMSSSAAGRSERRQVAINTDVIAQAFLGGASPELRREPLPKMRLAIPEVALDWVADGFVWLFPNFMPSSAGVSIILLASWEA